GPAPPALYTLSLHDALPIYREVARDIMGGLCDIGPANSYYVGLMRSGAGGAEQKTWGAAIDIALPRFENGGTHVSISGAGVARRSEVHTSELQSRENLVCRL